MNERFSLENIFDKCPLVARINGELYTTYEFTIKDAVTKLEYIYDILGTFTNFELECVVEDDGKLLNICSDLFIEDNNTMCDIIHLSHGIKLDKSQVRKSEYGGLLFNIIIQNNMINRILLIREMSIDKNKKQTQNGFDILDSIVAINQLGILEDRLTIKNWQEVLTYRQYEILLNKVRNNNKQQQINLYTAVLFAIAKGVGGDKTDFMDVIMADMNLIYESKELSERKQWFKEKCNDIDFIRDKLQQIAKAPNTFFTDDDIIKYNLQTKRKRLEDILKK
jgi:hypothetical protein